MRSLRTRRETRGQLAEAAIAAAMHPVRRAASDYDALLGSIGDARLVLIGEASHGTHEFYAERAAITKRLVLEKDFDAVCIEGDWPDAYRVGCWLKGQSDDGSSPRGMRRANRPRCRQRRSPSPARAAS